MSPLRPHLQMQSWWESGLQRTDYRGRNSVPNTWKLVFSVCRHHSTELSAFPSSIFTTCQHLSTGPQASMLGQTEIDVFPVGQREADPGKS